MGPLAQALDEHELMTLRVIAEWWEMDLTGIDKPSAVKALAMTLAAVDLKKELLYLQPEEASALNDLVELGGRAPVASFSRKHGEVRAMGPGRMEREEPWLDPVSGAEALWYRGFLYRGFDDTGDTVVEYFYLPDELLQQFPQAAEPETEATVLKPGSAGAEPAEAVSSASIAVDDLTTLLSLTLQLAREATASTAWEQLLIDSDPERRSLLLTLAHDMGLLLRQDGRVRPARAAVDWLKLPREGQMRALAEAWSQSEWNDLCHTPDIICEGEGWHNDPIRARTALLESLPRTTEWVHVADICSYLKEVDPDFQRPDGNYDTWYIRDSNQEGYLVGFANWDFVEGRLIRYMLQGPLRWLGVVDNGESDVEKDLLYRLTPRGLTWLSAEPPPAGEKNLPLVVQDDGVIVAGKDTNRYLRFQAARIAVAQPPGEKRTFSYVLTPASIAAAVESGITSERLLNFLTNNTAHPLPKSVSRAITRWSEKGVEGRLEQVVVLRVGDAAILETLRTNPKTRDFLGEMLGETAVAVRRDAWAKLRSATAQLGLLLDVDVDGSP